MKKGSNSLLGVFRVRGDRDVLIWIGTVVVHDRVGMGVARLEAVVFVIVVTKTTVVHVLRPVAV